MVLVVLSGPYRRASIALTAPGIFVFPEAGQSHAVLSLHFGSRVAQVVPYSAITAEYSALQHSKSAQSPARSHAPRPFLVAPARKISALWLTQQRKPPH